MHVLKVVGGGVRSSMGSLAARLRKGGRLQIAGKVPLAGTRLGPGPA